MSGGGGGSHQGQWGQNSQNQNPWGNYQNNNPFATEMATRRYTPPAPTQKLLMRNPLYVGPSPSSASRHLAHTLASSGAVAFVAKPTAVPSTPQASHPSKREPRATFAVKSKSRWGNERKIPPVVPIASASSSVSAWDSVMESQSAKGFSTTEGRAKSRSRSQPEPSGTLNVSKPFTAQGSQSLFGNGIDFGFASHNQLLQPEELSNRQYGGAGGLPQVSLMARQNLQGRSTMFKNESSRFFANLKAMYGAKLSALSQQRPTTAGPSRRPSQLLQQQREYRQEPSNLPQIPVGWDESRIQIPRTASSSAYINFNGPLSSIFSNQGNYFREQARIPLRQWENTKLGDVIQGDRGNMVGDGTRLTVMSYNVLAPKLLDAHQYLYRECDEDALPWEHRRRTLFSEISYYKPDILCLQEVEEKLLPDFDEVLYGEGYYGVYKKRTGDKVDGCAIYYRSSKFRFVDGIAVQYFQPRIKILNRDNIGLLLKLETVRGGKTQRFVIGTTHLLFNPKRQDVKVAQVQMLLAELDRLAFCGFDKEGRSVYHPTMITGDFNMVPYSPITKFVTEGILAAFDDRGQPLKSLSAKGDMEFIPHSMGISDQCQHYKVVRERLRGKKHKAFEIPCLDSNDLVNICTGSDLSDSPSKVNVNVTDEQVEGVEKADKRGSDTSVMTSATFDVSQEGDKNDKMDFTEEVDQKILQEVLDAGTLCTFGTGEFSHNFRFRDVHGVNHSGRGGADLGAATTRQNGWVCVDYIFYSTVYNSELGKPIEGKLKLLRRLGLLSRKQCQELGPIPKHDIPSDHFPVLAEFLLKP